MYKTKAADLLVGGGGSPGWGCLMTMAAHMLGTAVVPAKRMCTLLSAKRFFGPCITRLPFASTVPMSSFPRWSKNRLITLCLCQTCARACGGAFQRRGSWVVWRCIRVGRSPMVRIHGRRCNGEGGPRGHNQGRKLGRRSVCYEWCCEGGMEGQVCRCLDCQSGGVGCCCSRRLRREPGDVNFWMLETTVACGVGGSDIDLCLVSNY